MNMYLKLFILLSALVFVFIVLNTLRKKRISTKISMLWLIAAMIIIFSALFSEPLIILSGLLGFETPVNMIFFLGFLLLLIICFYLCMVISKQQSEITLLTQEVSLNIKRLKDKE